MLVPKLFSAAIVDYFLDDLREHLKGTEVAAALEGTPILLISSTEAVVDFNEPWGRSVRKFVGKKEGVDRILDEVLKLTQRTNDRRKAQEAVV